MRAEVVQLNQDILLDCGGHQIVSGHVGVLLFDDPLRGRSMSQPLCHRRHLFQFVRVQQSRHRAALRVATDDDVLDAESLHGELDRGRFAAIRCTVRRNDVTGVSERTDRPAVFA
jgi:hypothetical protein